VKATILIVDDSTFIVEGLVAILQRHYRAIPSFGGEECITILKTEKPDVIVLDIMMEPMDGWETLSRIKENPATRNIPVLMFTAKKITPEEAEAHRTQIGGVLIKPVSPKELITSIEMLLERERRNKEIVHYLEQVGIPRVTIDAYVTRSANLEVDRSLLATLQKNSPHSPAIPVTVLEDRIQNGRAVLDDLLKGTGLTVEFLNNLSGVPAPGSGDIPVAGGKNPVSVPVDSSGTGMPPQAESTPPLPEKETAEPVRTILPPDPVHDAPSPTQKDPVTDSVPASGSKPTTAVPVLYAIPPISAEPVNVPEPSVAIPADPSLVDTEQVAWIPIPSHADPTARDYSSGIDQRPGPDIAVKPLGRRIPKPVVVSVPASATRAGVPDMHKPSGPLSEAEPQGFFARILAAIKGIFSKKK
jgi:CheY-like chemotaxis protein